jgi:type IV pilus assembly protein PilO
MNMDMDPIELILHQKLSVKLVALFVMMGLIIGLYWMFFFKDIRIEIGAMEPELAQLKADLATKNEIVKEMPRYKAEFERTKGELDIALKQLPEKSEIPALLQSISDVGKAAGLEFVLFRPQSEVPKDFYAEIPIDIVVQGRFRDMLAFFDQVSKIPRIVTISNVVMGSPKSEGSRTSVTTTCNATTYKFIEEAKAK